MVIKDNECWLICIQDESFDISGSGLHMPRKPPAASNATTRNMKYNSGGAQDDKKSGKFSDRYKYLPHLFVVSL